MKITKTELSKYILQDDKPLDEDKFTWDGREFCTQEGNLRIDLTKIRGGKFTMGSNCEVKAGSGFIFASGDNCNFKTDISCKFTTGDKCQFVTSHKCEFNTGNECRIDAGSECTIVVGNQCHITAGNRTGLACGNDCKIFGKKDAEGNATAYKSHYSAGSNCEFETDRGCTFETKNNCTFKIIPQGYTSFPNIFYTGDNCKFELRSKWFSFKTGDKLRTGNGSVATKINNSQCQKELPANQQIALTRFGGFRPALF
jgi:hypothetical protein